MTHEESNSFIIIWNIVIEFPYNKLVSRSVEKYYDLIYYLHIWIKNIEYFDPVKIFKQIIVIACCYATSTSVSVSA